MIKYIPIALVLLLAAASRLLAQSSVKKDSVQLSFSELTIGSDYRYAQVKYTTDTTKTLSATAAGVTGRLQSSFIHNYLFPPRKNKRFLAGDLLAGEVSVGGLSKSDNKLKFWKAYKFEFGAGAIFRISERQDVGLNLILLRFARDEVSQNLSGSGILIKYRYSHIFIEAGVDSRRERIGGWLIKHGDGMNNPLHWVGGITYLIDRDEKIGIRYEELGRGKVVLNAFSETYTFINNFKIFYGIYF